MRQVRSWSLEGAFGKLGDYSGIGVRNTAFRKLFWKLEVVLVFRSHAGIGGVG